MYAPDAVARKGGERRKRRTLHECVALAEMRTPTVRPATLDDVDLLVAWHADPEVSRYWDDKTFSADEVRVRLARADVDSWIVEDVDEPVGYLQSWWEDGEPRRGGLDGFLVPAARGRGLMPAAARALARRLLASGWVEVTVDPYAWNGRAVRAWGRAGFVEVSRHPRDEEHTAEWVLMRFEVPGTEVPGTQPSCFRAFPGPPPD
jgi:aminoglycoside 6'-N-acetyltransferase